MIYVKIAALFLSLTGFGVWAWWGQASSKSSPAMIDVKTVVPGVSPEVRSKAFGLLEKMLAETGELKQSDESLAIQFLLADLLWEKDRARASSIFLSVAAAVEKGRCECAFFDLGVIAARDAKLAIQVLESSEAGSLTFDGEAIYDHLAKQYPDEALRRGKAAVVNGTFLDYLDLNVGYGANMPLPGSGRLSALYAANRAHGANLARDILMKVRASSIEIPRGYPDYNAIWPAQFPLGSNIMLPAPIYAANATNNAANAVNPMANAANYAPNYPESNILGNARRNANYWVARSATSGKRLPFSAAAALLTAAKFVEGLPQKGLPPMLTDEEKKSLASSMINALIASRGRFDIQQVAGTWGSLRRSAPRDAARLERLLTRRQRDELNSLASPFDLPSGPDAGDGVERPAADEADPESVERGFIFDLRFSSQSTCHFNRAEDAEKFVALKDPERYPDLIEYFGDDLAFAYAKAGNVIKVRTYLAREKDRLVKLRLLADTSAAVARKGDKQAAEKLIGEASALLPQNLKRRDEFGAVESYALALATVDANKGFEIVEKLLERADQLLGLRSELAEFSQSPDHDADGPAFNVRRRQIADNSAHSAAIIRVLAGADLDRTVKLADRFSEKGQRRFFRWYIINALLNRHAEMEERRFASLDGQKLCG